jgi:hypothetical protein
MLLKIPFYSLLIIVIFTGCRKAPQGFDMTYRRQFNLSVGLNPFQSHNFEFNNIAADTSIFFQVNGASSNTISRIIPKAMTLQAIFASPEIRYNSISQVEVWISNPNDPKVSPQIIFFRDDVPLNTDARLDLIPNNVDVKKFIVNGRFSVRINIRLRQITERSIETEWNTIFLAERL